MLESYKPHKTPICVVDIDPEWQRYVKEIFGQAGYSVSMINNSLESNDFLMDAIRRFYPTPIVLILGDRPEIFNTSRFVAEVRGKNDFNDLAIAVVSFAGDPEFVRGEQLLLAGADAYNLNEKMTDQIFVAGIGALARRFKPSPIVRSSPIQRNGSLEVNYGEHLVTNNGIEVPFTETEFMIFALMASRIGRIIPREEFLEQVWGFGGMYQALSVNISRMRCKLGDVDNRMKIIETVLRIGYRMRDYSNGDHPE